MEQRAEAEQDRQAATWLAKLKSPVVHRRDLAAFRAWRAEPGAEEAFRRLHGVWDRFGKLGADPDMRLLAQELRRRPTPRRRRRALGYAAASATAAVVGLGAFTLLGRQGQTYTTHVGEQSAIRLADGSLVHLDTDSRLVVRLGRTTRSFELARGQALFDVAHQPDRPFRVAAGGTTVTALGTQFDVRRDAKGAVTVVLLRGRVQVDARARGTWRLDPGQALRTADARPRPQPVDSAGAISWTTGRLVFHDTPLAEALQESNRYTPGPLLLGPGVDGRSLHVNGVFTAGDRAALAGAIGTLYGLRAEPRADGALVLQPAASRPG